MYLLLNLFRKLVQLIFSSFITLMLFAMVGFLGLYAYYAQQLPDKNQLKQIELQVPMRIYTDDGRLLGEYGEKRRRPLTHNDIPERVLNAFIAIEDARFYEHKGIDYKGIARAFLSAVTTGNVRQGASTITMQLARNAFPDIGNEKTLDRKIREALLSFEIERTFSKLEILELYLNKIFFGKGAHGLAAAAETYYGKQVHELTLAQTAMLAGLPKAPSANNPIVNPKRALIRRNYILKRMQQFDFISDAEFVQATAEPISAKIHHTEIEISSPYMAEMARSAVVQYFGKEAAYSKGYHIYTTLNVEKQKQLEESLRKGLRDYDRRHGYRGAEAKINLSDFSDIERLLEELSQYSVIADLEPAVVLESSANKARVLMLNEELVTISGKDIRWARKFISANRRGRKPYRVDHVMKPGDVIRLRKKYKPLPKPKKDKNGKEIKVAEVPLDKREFTWEFTQIPKVSGAMILMEPYSGAVEAIMGSYDFAVSKFNRATQARRQPGSSFKPFVYAAALAKGYAASSPILDAPIKLKNTDWKPKNFNGRYVGSTTLKEALAKSRNLAAIRLMKKIGVSYTIDFATLFGFQKERLPRNLTLSLGTGLTSPLEMATAYSTFANGGYRVNSYFITRITDEKGETLFQARPQKVCGDEESFCYTEEELKKKANLEKEARRLKQELAFYKLRDKKSKKDKAKKKENKPKEEAKAEDKDADAEQPKERLELEDTPNLTEEEIETRLALKLQEAMPTNNPNRSPAALRIMSAKKAYDMVTMLQAVTQIGTAKYATRTLKRKDIAGKTGTTNNERDAWFCGFNQESVLVTWVGFDNMAKLGKGETATRVALPIWTNLMGKLLKDKPEKPWKRPSNKKNPTEKATTKKAQKKKKANNFNQFQYQPSNNKSTTPIEALEIPEQIF